MYASISRFGPAIAETEITRSDMSPCWVESFKARMAGLGWGDLEVCSSAEVGMNSTKSLWPNELLKAAVQGTVSYS